MRHQLKLRLMAKERVALQEFARQDGEPLATLIRRVLRAYLRVRERHPTLPAMPREESPAGSLEPRLLTTIWLDSDDLRALDALASEDGISTATLIRTALTRYISGRQSQRARTQAAGKPSR
jgi:hypothetical protein